MVEDSLPGCGCGLGVGLVCWLMVLLLELGMIGGEVVSMFFLGVKGCGVGDKKWVFER